MPTRGEARSTANFSNARDLRLDTLASLSLPAFRPLPVPPASDLRGYPRRQSSLQAAINARSTATTSSHTAPAPAPTLRTPERTLFQPPSLNRYSPYTFNAAEEELQRTINTHVLHAHPPHVPSPHINTPSLHAPPQIHPSHAFDGADDLPGRFNRERGEFMDTMSRWNPTTNGSAQHAGMNLRVPPGLAELQRHALNREIALAQIRSRRQAMVIPMPPARVEHFASIPAIKLEDRECPICMEDYDEAEHCAIQLQNVNCDHVFGRSCIQEWVNSEMRNAHRCPSCRRSISGALVDASTGTSLIREVELARDAEVRRQIEYFQASLAPTYTYGHTSGPLQTPRVTSPSRNNARQAARRHLEQSRARSGNASPGHRAPSSSLPASTQTGDTGRLRQAHPPALSTQQRLARIRRDIAAMTSERGLRSSANVALAGSASGRLTSQDIQAMIDEREEEMRDLDRQIEAARITRDVLMRHSEEVDEEELQMFRRALGHED